LEQAIVVRERDAALTFPRAGEFSGRPPHRVEANDRR
jgi:hypothetical protein